MDRSGAFRFAYFTHKYQETFDFYESKLGLVLDHAWDRGDNDKGALFKAEAGLIEILLHPDGEAHRSAGLDYRSPQGVFVCIQTWEIDRKYDTYKLMGLRFKQELTEQPWGHRSFSLIEPNGLILFFFQESV